MQKSGQNVTSSPSLHTTPRADGIRGQAGTVRVSVSTLLALLILLGSFWLLRSVTASKHLLSSPNLPATILVVDEEEKSPKCDAFYDGENPPVGPSGVCFGKEGGPDASMSAKADFSGSGGTGGPSATTPSSGTPPTPSTPSPSTPSTPSPNTPLTPSGPGAGAATGPGAVSVPSLYDDGVDAGSQKGLDFLAAAQRGSVDLRSRGLAWGEVDASFPGVTTDLGLVIGRRYWSLSERSGAYGQGWFSNLWERLIIVSATEISWLHWGHPFQDPGFYFTGSGTQFFGPASLGANIDVDSQSTSARYKLTRKSGMVHEFDVDGKLTAWVDAWGNRITLEYSQENLTKVTDSRGQVFTITAVGGDITRIVDPLGGIYDYAYEDGLLTTVTYPARDVFVPPAPPMSATKGGSKTKSSKSATTPPPGTRTTARHFLYDVNAKLEFILDDAYQVLLTMEYESGNPGIVYKQTNALGGTYVFSEITSGNRIHVVTPRGFYRDYYRNSTNQVIEVRSYMANVDSQASQRPIPAGHPGYYKWQLTREGSCNCGMITKVIEPDLGAYELVYDTRYNLLELHKIPNGGTGTAQVWKWTYDAMDRKATLIPPEGNASQSPATYQITWLRYADTAQDNPGGLVRLKVIPARDWRTTASIWTTRTDSRGRILEMSAPPTNTTGDGIYTLYEHYPMGGSNDSFPKKRYLRKDKSIWEEYSWNKNGRLIQATTNTGLAFTQSYDAENNVKVWTGPLLGNQQHRHEWSYDAEGRLAELRWWYFDTAPGGTQSPVTVKWNYIYDTAGNLLQHEKDLDAITRAVWKYLYDTQHNPVELIDPDGRKETASYDERDLPWVLKDGVGSAQEAQREVFYTDDGEVAKVIEPLDTRTIEVHRGYDAYDRLNVLETPNETRAEIDWDMGTRAITRRLYAKSGSNLALVGRWTLAYDDFHDSATQQTTFVYDETGSQLLRSVTSRLYYSPAGFPLRMETGGIVMSDFEYETWGVPKRVFDQLGNEERFTFSANTGWLEKHEVQQANPVTPSSPLVLMRTFSRDGIGRVTEARRKATGKPDQVETFGYDSNDRLVSYTDAAGTNHDYKYRFDGSIIETREKIDTSTVRAHAYQYTASGLLSRVTDDRSKSTWFYYDGRGRRRQEMYPDGKSWNWAYNKADLLVSATAPDGRSIAVTYDSRGKPTQRVISKGSNTRTETYVFNAVGDLKKLTRTEGSVSTYVELVRDSQGLVLSENQDGTTVTYVRDSLGRAKEIHGPSGYKHYYEYDTRNRASVLKDSAQGTALATWQYMGPMSAVLTRSNRNGTSLSVSRNGFGQIEEIANKLGTGYVSRFLYGWDSRGMVTHEERVTDGKGDAYQYDQLYRLRKTIRDSSDASNVNWNNTGSIAHSYLREFQLDDDQHRNQVTTTPYQGTASSVAYTTDANRHHYTNVGGLTRSFDFNGNLTAHGTRTYSYDISDKLVEAKNGSTTLATYAYDAFGRRRSKTVGTVTTRYVYAGPWILEEHRKDGANPEQLDAVHYHGTGVDEVVMSLRRDHADLDQDLDTGEMIELWHHGNRLGSTMELTLSNGTTVESYRYEAFGSPTIRDRQNNLVTATPSGNPFLFTGREYDSETGLYHYRARTYDPETGGFLQEDPLGMEDDINVVSYALSNPITWVDPMGTLSISEAFSGLMDFLSNNAQNIADLIIDGIPFLSEILDIMSALSGRDITGWIKGGLKGTPASLGFWARISVGAVAGVMLAGSAFGIVAKFAKIMDFIKDKMKKAKAAAAAAARKARDVAAAAARKAKELAKKVVDGGCFARGTPVLLACGCFVPIQDVRVGDVVQAEIPAAVATGKPERGAYRVTATSVRMYDGAIHEITLEDASGKRDVIRGTPEHPVWSPETRHWVALADLRMGQAVMGQKASVRVVDKRITFERARIYNLTVDKAQSYRIGNHGFLVHNGCPAPSLTPPGAGRRGAFREAKRLNGIPVGQQPSRVGGNIDRRGMKQPGRTYEFDVPAKGGGKRKVVIRDDAGGHNFGPGNPQNRGPHFNDAAGNHYDY